MKNTTRTRSDEQEVGDPTNGVGDRIGFVIATKGLNQNQFAKLIGASPAFVSDVIRKQKKPGTEFLFAIKKSLSISIDWLFTGAGSMNGLTPIDHEIMQFVKLRVSIVRMAYLENDPIADEVLTALEDGSLPAIIERPNVQALLLSALKQDAPIDLAVRLYNFCVSHDNWAIQGRLIIEEAKSYFGNQIPVNFSRLLSVNDEKLSDD